MATGMARGAAARGKRIAFGDGKRIIYSPWSEHIFRGNPNVAPMGAERSPDIEWIAHYKGHRLYNSVGSGIGGNRWVWNMEFRATPGEMFFTTDELAFAQTAGSGFIVIEPNVPSHKEVAPNKDWGRLRYEAVACELAAKAPVIQFWYPSAAVWCRSAKRMMVPSFRHALAVLSRAALYIGPEGGLHHGAAAVGTHAVVLFGGFVPPQVTGYQTHTNLTGGATACGKMRRCLHCRAAMDAISVEKVLHAARRYLEAAA